jgi:hypothetical protein
VAGRGVIDAHEAGAGLAQFHGAELVDERVVVRQVEAVVLQQAVERRRELPDFGPGCSDVSCRRSRRSLLM